MRRRLGCSFHDVVGIGTAESRRARFCRRRRGRLRFERRDGTVTGFGLVGAEKRVAELPELGGRPRIDR